VNTESKFDLNNLIMNAVKTAENGVINEDTIFEFSQFKTHVSAKYSGGSIEKGYLVGILSENNLEFRYCQMQVDETLDSGHSFGEVRLSENGLIQIVEKFEWESRPGSGTNIIQELRKTASE
jgi:hypothetical protein